MKAKVLSISNENPLDVQLRALTGDGWNSHDWSDTLPTGIITHKKTGTKVRVLSPDQEHALSLYRNRELTHAGDLQDENVKINENGVAACLQGHTGFVAGKFHSSINGTVYVVITDKPWKSGSHMSAGHCIGLEERQFNRMAI
jgi:hypothetical protein